MTESDRTLSHQPDQATGNSRLLRFEETEGNKRRVLVSPEIMPVLSLLKENMNRFGMGGVWFTEAEDQEGVGDLRRMDLSAVYSHPLDFLAAEMENAVATQRGLLAHGATNDQSLEAISESFSVAQMQARYGEFHQANLQRAQKEILGF